MTKIGIANYCASFHSCRVTCMASYFNNRKISRGNVWLIYSFKPLEICTLILGQLSLWGKTFCGLHGCMHGGTSKMYILKVVLIIFNSPIAYHLEILKNVSTRV